MIRKIKEYLEEKINLIRRFIFHRKNTTIQTTSGIGRVGVGDHCHVEGGYDNISIGEHSWVKEQAELITYRDGKIIIGNNVGIMPRIRITSNKCVTIGNNVLIGPEVFITDHNHGMNPEIITGYSSQPLTTNTVEIKEGCWLGQRVIVLPGVVIGEHSIVGAGSVVAKSIPAFCIAVGVPAKVIKTWDHENKKWVAV